MHYFSKIFAHVRKKQYLCNRFLRERNYNFHKCLTTKIVPIMKKVYVIDLFNAQTKKYVSTYKEVYATEELAQLAVKNMNNPYLIFRIVKINMIHEKDFIEE